MFETLLAAISGIAIIIGWLIAIFRGLWKISFKLESMNDRLKELKEKDHEIISKVSDLNLTNKRLAKRVSMIELFLSQRYRDFIKYQSNPRDLD